MEQKRRAEDKENHDLTKEAMKEALKEWLDEKYAAFGKWTLHGLLASGLAFLAYLLFSNGSWPHH